MPTFMHEQALLAAGLGIALTGCLSGDTKSAHNEEGAPRVIAVTVVSESARGEAATFCASPEDERTSTLYCPGPGDDPVTAVTDAAPLSWQARLVFNERLDPDEVEDLVEDENGNILGGTLANTQPVMLTCAGEAIPYDGYYDPSGSHDTDPPGPSIVIIPDGFVATGTECQVAVKDGAVHDKDGKAIEAGAGGPFTYSIAAMAIAKTEPGKRRMEDPDPTGVVVTVKPLVVFNALVDEASIAGKVELVTTADDLPVEATLAIIDRDEDDDIDQLDAVQLSPAAPLADATQYTLRVTGGILDTKGGELRRDAPFEITFTTADAAMGM